MGLVLGPLLFALALFAPLPLDPPAQRLAAVFLLVVVFWVTETIPLAARIAAVADSLDALTTARAYRAAVSWEDSIREIRAGFGSQYDPRLEEAFLKALPSLRQLCEEHQLAETLA